MLSISLSAFAQAGGSIRARFTDTAGAAIVASISIFHARDGPEIHRGQADSAGVFQAPALKPGPCRMIARAAGFRRLDIPGLQVNRHRFVDLGALQMEFAGCDAPGVHCLPIGAREHPPDVRAESGDYRGLVRMQRPCGVDIGNEAKVACPESGGRRDWWKTGGIDLRLVQARGRLYLEAVNGATLSIPKASQTGCAGARFGLSRILVEASSMGGRFVYPQRARFCRACVLH